MEKYYCKLLRNTNECKKVGEQASRNVKEVFPFV